MPSTHNDSLEFLYLYLGIVFTEGVDP